ncbi:MAG: ribonuclease HI family protein [Candidatus Bathyarchaeia archaeon]
MQFKNLNQLQIYSDGASRGNPGPTAIAVKIVDENGVVIKKFSKFLGKRTNNEAEYEALIIALKLALEFTRGLVDCFLDSELVVKQLNGEYQVRKPRLKRLWLKVHELQQHFEKVSFNHVSRVDKNIEEVDKLANCVLDRVLC